METIALINLTLEKAKATTAALPSLYVPPPLDPDELELVHIPRDREGRYYAHTTLVMCPVNLIAQWILECKTVSTRPLKILEYHSTTARTPLSEILQYDIVITAYSMMPSLLRTSRDNYDLEAHQRPWAVRDHNDVRYMNALFRVHWHRVVLDESHLMKNNASTVFQACERLYSQRRWLLSGTPFNASVMDLRSQCQFLQIQHMDHAFFDKTLKPLMVDRATLERVQQMRQQQQHHRGGGGAAHRKNQANAMGLAAAAMSDDDGGDSTDEEDANYPDTPAERAQRAKRAIRRRSFQESVRVMESPPANINKVHERTIVPVEKRRKYAVANTIFTMVCKNMMRHVRDQPYMGRAMLYELPSKTSQVVSVPLTDKQKALYAKMLSIAQTRYKELKRRGLATRKAIEVMQTLLPMRRACSSLHVDVAAIEAEIKRIEGVLEEMILNPAAAMNLLPAYGDAEDDCPVRNKRNKGGVGCLVVASSHVVGVFLCLSLCFRCVWITWTVPCRLRAATLFA